MIRYREAVILAGGFGTRLAHVVPDVPKPMAPVARRPFLRFILDQLAEERFKRVVIADGYKRECIEGYFGNAYRGMKIEYSSETEPLLTGGAVKRALGCCDSKWVYVLNGDTFLDIDFDAMDADIARCEPSTGAIIAVRRLQDFDRYGTVEIDEDSGIIEAFHEKRPCREGMVNAGVYAIRKNALDAMPKKFSLETDWFEKIVPEGRLVASESKGDFIDIGVPEDYKRAQHLLALRARTWKLAIFDRDGTINVDTGHLHEPEKLELIESTVELIRQYNEKPDWKVIVATNQAGIAKGYYSEKDMGILHDALDSELAKRGASIDAYYFCPHHPDFTGECDCRKPRPGMIQKAIFDFEANPANCIMYGDKESDVAAATSAGVKGVLL